MAIPIPVDAATVAHTKVLEWLIGILGMMGVAAVLGFFKVLWNRGDKFVLKETCKLCQDDWKNHFTAMHEKIDLLIDLVRKP